MIHSKLLPYIEVSGKLIPHSPNTDGFRVENNDYIMCLEINAIYYIIYISYYTELILNGFIGLGWRDWEALGIVINTETYTILCMLHTEQNRIVTFANKCIKNVCPHG